jgi:hypothetical protein
MSVMFMGLAMAVYATHKNWRQQTEALKTQLADQQKRNQEAEAEHNRKFEELSRERDAARQQAAKLETERTELAKNNVKIEAERDKLVTDQREHIAAVKATQDLNTQLAGEVTDLRSKLRDEQQARDAAFAKALDATERLQQESGDYTNALERSRQLMKEVAGLRSAMTEYGHDPNVPPGSVVPTVDGIVSQVRRTGGAQLVEVTIGADDGLKTGNTLEVFRGSKYLGRLDVIETTPDKSVGRVLRNFQQGQIQEGDRVATRIKP